MHTFSWLERIPSLLSSPPLQVLSLQEKLTAMTREHAQAKREMEQEALDATQDLRFATCS